ncbi:MAG: hypothetical protein AB7G08_32065 [Hyphomicrobiaceae bacterium]
MKAIALIEGAAYGPDALKAMTQAFDKAWACVAHHFENNPEEAAHARERLAHAVLALADADAHDVDALKCTALKVLALSYGRPLTTSQG